MLLAGFVLLLLIFVGGPQAEAHSPLLDSDLSDWCVGAPSNTAFQSPTNRVEDRAIALSCGTCSTDGLACESDADCSGSQTCSFSTLLNETALWDNRTDGAVNDLASFATTQDDQYLYFAAELWIDPDPVSIPLAQVAIDYKAGGVDKWHDPKNRLLSPGRCSVSTDRACASDQDCRFCPIATEPTGACSNDSARACRRGVNTDCASPGVCVTRKKVCGSGCDDLIPTEEPCPALSETCEGLGDGGLITGIGNNATPEGDADYLVLFDFGIWLNSIDNQNGMLLLEPGTDLTAFPLWFGPWAPVKGCPVDSPSDPTDRCDFVPVVNPGASGASTGPPGSVEAAIPWCAFGCTNCPEFGSTPGSDDCGNATDNSGCDCPAGGFGPGVDFRFTLIATRDVQNFDFAPEGAMEDVLSEPVAQTSTTTNDDCPGFGFGTTLCEVADQSVDSMALVSTALPQESNEGGRINGLLASKSGGSVKLDWRRSCSTADTQYGVYEGTIGGSFNSHTQVACSVAGLTSTVSPGAGNRYYLVVPTNGSTEGSYGTDSGGTERPVGVSPCVGAQTNPPACP